MIDREAVLDRVRSQLGVRESPPGSNRGPSVDMYTRVTGTPGQPWCASFVSWICVVLGVPFKVRAAVWRIVADARDEGRLHVVGDGYEPCPCDLAIRGRRGMNPLKAHNEGHVAFVEAADEGSVTVIGGNQGDGVTRETWSRDDVLAYVRLE